MNETNNKISIIYKLYKYLLTYKYIIQIEYLFFSN